MEAKTLYVIAAGALAALLLFGCNKTEDTAKRAMPRLAESDPRCLEALKPKTEAERRKYCPPGFAPSPERKW